MADKFLYILLWIAIYLWGFSFFSYVLKHKKDINKDDDEGDE